MNDTKDELSLWNFQSIFQYIIEHYIQFLLLLLVPVIIYIVDHISNINSMIFGLPSAIPGLSTQQQHQHIKNQRKKSSKK
jgi:hypothetical protein